MFCTQCGAHNTEDSRFCRQCGHRLQPAPKPMAPLDESVFQLDSPEQLQRVQGLLDEALKHEQAGQLNEAILACEAVLVIDPANTSAHSLLGLIYEKQGELDKAVQEYEKVVALNPGSVADRAKLDALRQQLRLPGPRLQPREEQNYAPLLIGAFVTVGLFVLGLAVYTYQERPVPTAQQPPPTESAAPPAQQPGFGAYSWTYPLQAPYSVPSTTPQTPSVAQPEPAPQQSSQRPTDVRAQRAPLPPLPPMTVLPSQSPPSEQSNRPSGTENGGSIVMPDVPVQPGQGAQPPGRQPVMEITVRPGTAAGTALPPPSMESEELARVAQQHQLAGRYREAIALYQKALVGTNDRGYLYQQIGLCHQRQGELDAARNAYQQAIAEYERQIAANQNVERARRGLEAARQGLAACGG